MDGFSRSRGLRMLGADIGQQTGGGRLDHIKDDLETVFAAVIGVGDIAGAEVRRELHERVQAVRLPRRAEGAEGVVVFRIHGDHVIVAVKILRLGLAGALRGNINAAPAGGGRGAAVGGVADVPVADAGGIGADLTGQALAVDQRPEDAFGGGRPADVTETDEENFNQRLAPIGYIPD